MHPRSGGGGGIGFIRVLLLSVPQAMYLLGKREEMGTEIRGMEAAPSGAGAEEGDVARSVMVRGTDRGWPVGRRMTTASVLRKAVADGPSGKVRPERGCVGSVIVT